jgi:SAM-dependent methyltransferase
MGVRSAQHVLDVGAGVGHWGRCVARVLPPGSTIVGVDREPRWVAEATGRAAELSLSHMFRYQESCAEQLPFAAESFDLVTCQTLLIHVPEPERVLREMLRVLRPGGALWIAEPNNMGSFAASCIAPDMDLERALRLMRFEMRCELGKARLGLGFNSLGESLPGLLSALGCEAIEVAQNERCDRLVPPYSRESERAHLEELRSFVAQGIACWPREEARRYGLAQGMTLEEFEREYDFALACERERLADMEAGRFVRAGGSAQYLFTARKPPALGSPAVPL